MSRELNNYNNSGSMQYIIIFKLFLYTNTTINYDTLVFNFIIKINNKKLKIVYIYLFLI